MNEIRLINRAECKQMRQLYIYTNIQNFVASSTNNWRSGWIEKSTYMSIFMVLWNESINDNKERVITRKWNSNVQGSGQETEPSQLHFKLTLSWKEKSEYCA